jgi:hypothetical protein
MVLGRRPHHRRATDVDLLDALLRPGTGRHGLGERVQVADQQVERRHLELVQLRQVLGLAGVGEQAGMDPGVQRLDPPVQALRERGDLLDPGHRHAGVGDPLRGRPGGDDLHAGRVQAGGQIQQAGLVVDADQRAPNWPAVTLGAGGHGMLTSRPVTVAP